MATHHTTVLYHHITVPLYHHTTVICHCTTEPLYPLYSTHHTTVLCHCTTEPLYPLYSTHHTSVLYHHINLPLCHCAIPPSALYKALSSLSPDDAGKQSFRESVQTRHFWFGQTFICIYIIIRFVCANKILPSVLCEVGKRSDSRLLEMKIILEIDCCSRVVILQSSAVFIFTFTFYQPLNFN